MMDFEIQGITLSGARRLLQSPSFICGYRALAVVATIFFLISSAPNWIERATLHSPFLGINVVIVIALCLMKLCRRYSGDVNVTVLRLVTWLLHVVRRFRDEYLVAPSAGTGEGSVTSSEEMKRRENRKLVRISIMLLMVQHCLAPANHMIWIHSVLTYTFLPTVVSCLVAIFREIHSSTAIGVRLSGDETADPSDQPQSAPANRQPPDNLRPAAAAAAPQAPQPPLTPHPLSVWVGRAVTAFKLVFCVTTLWYQLRYAGLAYVTIAGIYFSVSQRYAEKYLVRKLESLQIEAFEGLEQHYVSGAFGFLEVFSAFVFMTWTLLLGKQYLMVVALYTNIYLGSRDVISHVVSAAFLEWAILAHFEKATRAELEALSDVCPVCLSAMKVARRTPCRHYFHGHCLRRCLNEKNACPMCTQRLI